MRLLETERWSPALHGPLVSGWIRARGLGEDAGDLSLLPTSGFVIGGIAVGFIYLTNSSLAFMDGFMTDPASDPKERSLALDLLIVALFDEARSLGYKAVAGTTSAQPLADRLAQHGFNVIAGSYAARRV